MLDLLNKGILQPDYNCIQYAQICIIVGIVIVLLIYFSTIVIMEIGYFIYCKVHNEEFDLLVVIEALTDYKDDDYTVYKKYYRRCKFEY